jgi:hypothetical protein
MSLARTLKQTEYPESDGRPMGETDVHWPWMVRIRYLLEWRYRGSGSTSGQIGSSTT